VSVVGFLENRMTFASVAGHVGVDLVCRSVELLRGLTCYYVD
jgi:hypothetical protein